MVFKEDWNRRSFLGAVAAAATALLNPGRLFGLGRAPVTAGGGGVSVTGFGSTGNVYEELGVTTVINGEGTMTYLGGSLMRPEVEAVMAMAGSHFVPIVELETAAGKRIAEMLKLPED